MRNHDSLGMGLMMPVRLTRQCFVKAIMKIHDQYFSLKVSLITLTNRAYYVNNIQSSLAITLSPGDIFWDRGI